MATLNKFDSCCSCFYQHSINSLRQSKIFRIKGQSFNDPKRRNILHENSRAFSCRVQIIPWKLLFCLEIDWFVNKLSSIFICVQEYTTKHAHSFVIFWKLQHSMTAIRTAPDSVFSFWRRSAKLRSLPLPSRHLYVGPTLLKKFAFKKSIQISSC